MQLDFSNEHRKHFCSYSTLPDGCWIRSAPRRRPKHHHNSRNKEGNRGKGEKVKKSKGDAMRTMLSPCPCARLRLPSTMTAAPDPALAPGPTGTKTIWANPRFSSPKIIFYFSGTSRLIELIENSIELVEISIESIESIEISIESVHRVTANDFSTSHEDLFSSRGTMDQQHAGTLFFVSDKTSCST